MKAAPLQHQPSELSPGHEKMTQGATWAKQNGVEVEFGILRSLARLDRFNSLGTFQDFLSLETTRGLLLSWSSDSQASKQLYALSRALSKAPSQSEFAGGATLIGTKAPAAKLFPGELKHCYVGAAIAVAATRSLDVGWRQMLPAWLLVHAAHRTSQGNVADRNLRKVAQGIYNFDKLGTNHKVLFETLTSDLNGAQDFASFNLNILAGAERLRRSKKHLSDSEQEMLRAMARVANYEQAIDESQRASILPLPAPQIQSEAGCLVDLPEEDTDEPGCAETISSRASFLSVENEEEASTLEFTVKPSASLEQQKSLGRSIQLLDAEQRQFLPWMWSTPNPHETEVMLRWIEESLVSTDLQRAVFSALVWIGCCTGRSLARVLEIPVSEELGQDWSISPSKKMLHREPPQRHNGWKPRTPAAEFWVADYAEWQGIKLPVPLAGWIARRGRQPFPSSLAEIWADVSVIGCEAYFDETLGKELPRVKPGMIAGILGQSIYRETADDALARLLASSSRTGLPAACAYANWQADVLPEPFHAFDGVGGNVIALGSRLDPIEDLLVDAIGASTTKLLEARNSDAPFEFHNRYVAYLVMQLLAATGGRPVSDPFESIGHFDFEQKLIYLDDKASGEARQGRLVPVPANVLGEIRGEYRRHLAMLSHVLIEAHPELAAEIALLAEGRDSSLLPLFFFLASTDGMPAWQSVSESSLESLDLFDWPLPMNLFRQRLSKQLRRKGLNPEIIDGLLGHGEAYGLSYGDYSCRVWAEDMMAARPVLDACFDALGFQPVSSWQTAPQKLEAVGSDGSLSTRPFGHAAREKARRRTRRNAFRVARARIDRFLNGSELSALSEDQLYELSKRLLLNEKGMPTAAGHHQYDYLILKIRQWEKRNRKRIKLGRRFIRERTEHSPFAAQAVGARQRIDALRKAIEDQRLDAATSRTGRLEAGIVAALLLALEHRISDARLLYDVILNTNIRRVQADGKAYLEHGFFEKKSDPLTPVRRIALSARVAALLSISATQAGKPARLGAALPKALAVIAPLAADDGSPVPASPRELVELVAAWVDQWNAMTLPGIKAGVLAGRVPTFSGTWSDMLKIRKNKRPVIPREEGSPAEAVSLEQHLLRREAVDEPLEADEKLREETSLARQATAREFFAGIRRILAGDLSGDAEPSPENKSKSPGIAVRERKGKAMLRLIKRCEGRTSSAVLLLGEWTAHLLTHEANRQKLSSVGRYLGALSPAFEQVACDADLLSMDEEEITDLYVKIMEFLTVDDKKYVDDRLVMFHRWAEYSEYALPAPDWSEVPGIPPRDSISAGVVAEDEYLAALRLLESSRQVSIELRLMACFLMICGYRLGLRKSEAWGMTRDDWTRCGDQVVVLVRSNRYRSLKRPWSRRQVPLLFDLTPLEHDIVERCLATAEGSHGENTSIAILADPQGALPSDKEASALVNLVLKQVTGHPKMSLHHLRHSFANRVAVALLGENRQWAEALGWARDNRAAIQRMLLGNTEGKRRTTWALARLMGHMGGRTTFRSYLHFLWEWHEGETFDSSLRQGKLPGFITLDDLAEHVPPQIALLELAKPIEQALTFASALRFLRLLWRGREVEDAARQLELDIMQCRTLAGLTHAVGERMELSKTARDDRTAPHPLEFIRRVTESGWGRLLAISPADDQAQRLPENAMELLGEMIGTGRQMVMWNPDTFHLGRVLLSLLGLDDSRLECVCTNDFPEQMRIQAAAEGFAPMSLAHAQELRRRNKQSRKKVVSMKAARKRKKPRRQGGALQLDKAQAVPSPSQRCVVILKEDAEATIRSSIEFALALVCAASVYAASENSSS